MENLDNAFNIDVIKESRDVEEDNGCDKLAFDSRLSLMYKAKGGVRSTVVIARSELGRGKDVEGVSVRENPLGNDLLE